MNGEDTQLKSGWSNELMPYIETYEGSISMRQILLGVVGVAGIISIAVLVPNAMRILKFIDPDKWIKRSQKYRINEAVKRLKKDGFVVIENGNSTEPQIHLTQKGVKHFQQFQVKIGSNRRQTWDGRWRILIFDVAEKKRKVRNQLRYELTSIGFRKLQNSVWVYPYECEDLIALLKADLKLGRDVLYFVTEKMMKDDYLRSLFALQKSKMKK